MAFCGDAGWLCLWYFDVIWDDDVMCMIWSDLEYLSLFSFPFGKVDL